MRHLASPFVVLAIAACSQATGTTRQLELSPPTERAVSVRPKLTVDSLLETLSVRGKVGQLIMPWLSGSYVATEADAFDTAAAWVEEFGVGGIIISVGSPLDAAAKLNRLQRRSRLPLMVAADLEFGAAMRMIGATAFPMQMAFGATGRELDAYQLGRITALEARAIGIHWTFSPVSDVNNNPANPIINTRSFGESPHAVAKLVAAYVRGASDHGLFTTAKHFPGHGDTGTDSHIQLPVLDACWDRLDSLELVPFRAAIEAGVTSIMTAHIALTCFDPDDPLPATLSPSVMTGVLRDSLGFDGMVVTDALTMGAIISRFGAGESAVRAFLAGSDLLLMPDHLADVVDAMVAAIDSGRITLDRLDGSVRKMLVLKEKAGLFAARTVSLDSIPATVGRRAHQEVADDIAARALTLVQQGPLSQFRGERTRTAVITYAEETNHSIGSVLIRELVRHGDTIARFRIYPTSGPMSYDSARSVIRANPRVVFASSVRPISARGHVALPAALADLIVRTGAERPTVLVSFGSPYLLSQIPSYSGTFILAWNAVAANERAAANALAGNAAIAGKSPITLSDRFPLGHGITVPAR